MPTFTTPAIDTTGATQWNDAFGSLKGALSGLFDPSKGAQAYYYGAESRKALTDAAKARSDSAAKAKAALGVFDPQSLNAPPGYDVDPTTGYTVMRSPAAGGPAAAPAAGPAAAPAAGPAAAPATPSLSSIIPGAGAPAGDPRASINIQAAPNGQLAPGHWNSPTTTPDQMVQQLSAKVENSSGGMPPAGTPPTGSNGTQVPDPSGTLSGTIAPSSVNASGTDTPAGTIQAPPAGPNGSMPPLSIDLQKLDAMLIAANVPADQIYAQNKAVIGRARETGKISQPVADAMLANYGGDATSRNAQIAKESAANVANIESKRLIDLKGMDPQTYVPAGGPPSTSVTRPLRDVIAEPGGVQSLTPGAVTAGNVIIQVMKDGKLTSMPQWQATQLGLSPYEPPKPISAEEHNKNQQLNYNGLQRAYPISQKGMVTWGVSNPVALTPEAEAAVQERTDQLMKTQSYLVNNQPAAYQIALSQIKAEHGLASDEEINALRKDIRKHLTPEGIIKGDPRVSTYLPPGQPAEKATQHMMVGLNPNWKPHDVTPPISTAVPTASATPPAGTPPAGAPRTPPAGTPFSPRLTAVPPPPMATPATAAAAAAAPTQTAPTQTVPQQTPFGSGTLAGAITDALHARVQPPYLGPGSGRFATPPVSAATAAPQAPAAPATSQPGDQPPPGSVGAAPPNTPNGPTKLSDGRQAIIVDGWVYLAQQE